MILLVVAWLFMPQAMSVLAPGFSEDAEQRRLAIELTRITFPYLLLITLVTLYGGMLNVMHRFASAAAASIFLNIAMMATLAVAVWFPTPGHAAAWGVLISGFLQYFLLAGDLATHGGLPRFAPLRLDEDIRAFFRALGPATIGSMGTQVAMFADTIIATFLPAGALSALYYADRLNQLPIGVIGIAVGTVLLPEMARRISAGDQAGAMASQRRAFDFTLLLSVPFVAAFLAVPETITRALFARGAFSKADAAAAGATLAAYAVGLIPFVLIRSAVATFYARKDTATPVKASLTGLTINMGLKLLLMGAFAQIGLALATAVGAWVNLLLVLGFAVRAGYLELNRQLWQSLLRFAVSGVVLAAALWFAARFAATHFEAIRFRDEATLLLLIGVGAVVYAACVLLLFGPRWLEGFSQGLMPFARAVVPLHYGVTTAGNRRQDGCSRQIRRRSKRPSQGGRCTHPRQGPLHRRRRAAAGTARADAALAACACQVHPRCDACEGLARRMP